MQNIINTIAKYIRMEESQDLVFDAITQAKRLAALQVECAALLDADKVIDAAYEAARAEYKTVEAEMEKAKKALNKAKEAVATSGYAMKNAVDEQCDLMLSLAHQLLAPAIIGTKMQDASLGKWDGDDYVKTTVQITEVTFAPVHLAKRDTYDFSTHQRDDTLVPKPFDKYRTTALRGLLGVCVTGFRAVELKANGQPGKKVHTYEVDDTGHSDELRDTRRITRELANKSLTAWQADDKDSTKFRDKMFPAYYEFDGSKACFAEVSRMPTKSND